MTEVHRKEQLGSLQITYIEYKDEDSPRTNEIEIHNKNQSQSLKIVEEDLKEINAAVDRLKEGDI